MVRASDVLPLLSKLTGGVDVMAQAVSTWEAEAGRPLKKEKKRIDVGALAFCFGNQSSVPGMLQGHALVFARFPRIIAGARLKVLYSL